MNHVEQALGMAIYAANLAGDWETSRTYLSELVHVAPDGSWGFGGQAYMDAMTGDADGFLDVIKTSAPASFFVLGQMAAIGVDLFGEGGLEPWILESSVKLCREAIADDSISNIYKEAALLSLAYSAPMRADHDECAELLECIRPQGRHMAFFAGAHIGRIRGRLMHHLNKLDEAYEEYSETETLLRHAGFRPEFVALCRDFAGLLSDRDAPGDREKATDLQDEAIAIATELGMKPLLERVLAQRDTLTA
jgi:hypothetical protein